MTRKQIGILLTMFGAAVFMALLAGYVFSAFAAGQGEMALGGMFRRILGGVISALAAWGMLRFFDWRGDLSVAAWVKKATTESAHAAVSAYYSTRFASVFLSFAIGFA